MSIGLPQKGQEIMYIKECIKEIERVGGRQGRLDFLRLDMNENI